MKGKSSGESMYKQKGYNHLPDLKSWNCRRRHSKFLGSSHTQCEESSGWGYEVGASGAVTRVLLWSQAAADMERRRAGSMGCLMQG